MAETKYSDLRRLVNKGRFESQIIFSKHAYNPII